MKAFCLTVVLAGAALSFCGCATPGYSGNERWQLITRNWGQEEKQMNDDIDVLLLLRPMSHMTMWHVR